MKYLLNYPLPVSMINFRLKSQVSVYSILRFFIILFFLMLTQHSTLSKNDIKVSNAKGKLKTILLVYQISKVM